MARKNDADPKAKTTATASDEGAEIISDDEIVNPKQSQRDAIFEQVDADRRRQFKENGVVFGDEEEDKDGEAAGAEVAEGEDADTDDGKPKEGGDGDGKDGDGAEGDGEASAAAADEGDGAEGEDGEGTDGGEGAVKQPADTQQTFTVVVDGAERQVTLEELRKSYQIEEAARARLNQANQILDQAEQVRRATAQPAPAQPQGDAAAAATQDPPAEPDWAALADDIQFGQRDKAAEALRKAATALAAQNRGSTGDQPALTPEQIELRVLDQVNWSNARRAFGEQFRDIVEDDNLATMTAAKAREYFNEHVEQVRLSGRPALPDWHSIWTRAGNDVRGWVGGIKGATDGNPGPKPNANDTQPASVKVKLDPGRTEAKRTATPTPKPRAVQTASPTETPKPKSADQIRREGIDDILKHRQKVQSG